MDEYTIEEACALLRHHTHQAKTAAEEQKQARQRLLDMVGDTFEGHGVTITSFTRRPKPMWEQIAGALAGDEDWSDAIRDLGLSPGDFVSAPMVSQRVVCEPPEHSSSW